MIKRKKLIVIILLIHGLLSFSQNDFFMIGKTQKVTIPFKLINNLMIIPVNLNGQDLNFILDTGVSRTILFNVEMDKQYDLKNTQKIRIKGLGQGNFYEAIKSNHNLLRINKIVSVNLNLFYLINTKIDFSARLGINIHGLIGADFFDDFVVKVNYVKKKMEVYLKDYSYKICKKCVEIPLTFTYQKPYLFLDDKKLSEEPLKMLIDSGSSDAIWFFYNKTLKKHTRYMVDLLGVGVSGEVYGKRTKRESIVLDKFNFKDVVTCFPDSTSYQFLDKRINRDGSIGGEILKRFHVLYDYSKKKMILKKNGYYNKPFLYNVSGIYIMYNGKFLVQKTKSDIQFQNTKENTSPIIKFTYDFSFENSYLINHVREGSVAEKIGLKSNDVILKVNGTNAYNFSLEKLNFKLSNDVGKKVKLTVLRNNVEYTFTYKIEDVL